MTTEPTPVKTDSRPPNESSYCRGPVAARRPSDSGRHYCSKPDCQAAKQRYYRRMRTETGFKSAADRERERAELAQRQADARDDQFVLVIKALAAGERVYCEECKRKDALPGYVHPDPESGAPCRALRTLALPSGAGDKVVAAIWP